MMEGDKAASDAVSLILIKVHDHSRIQLLSCKAKLQSCKTKLHGRNVKLQICKFARENCKTARQSCTVTLSSCKFVRLQNQAAMLPVVSLDPIPCSQVNILKNQRPPQKNKPRVKVPGRWITWRECGKAKPAIMRTNSSTR